MSLSKMITQIKMGLHRFKPKFLNGFALLEVILSILIIASGITLVIRSYTTTLRAAEVASALAKACSILEEKIFELDTAGFKKGIPAKDEDGQVEGEEYYRYRISAAPVETKKTVKLNKVDLAVMYAKGSLSREIGVSTFLKYKES